MKYNRENKIYHSARGQNGYATEQKEEYSEEGDCDRKINSSLVLRTC